MVNELNLTKEDLYNYYQYGWESYWIDKVDEKLHPLDTAYGRILKNIIELIQFEKEDNLTVLDLGCGVGIYTINLLKMYPKTHMTGVDLSKKQIALARELARQHGVDDRVKFICGDAEEWTTDQKYDLVICTEILEHLLDPQKALKNISSITRENSTLIFSVPQIYGDQGAEGIFYKQVLDDGTVIESKRIIANNDKPPLRYLHRAYTLNDIEQLLAQSGVFVEQVIGSTFKIPLKDSTKGILFVRAINKICNMSKMFINLIVLKIATNRIDVKLNELTAYRFAETLLLRCRKTGND